MFSFSGIFGFFFFVCLDWRIFNVFVGFFLILPSTAGASTSALSDLPLTWMLTQGAHIKKNPDLSGRISGTHTMWWFVSCTLPFQSF